MLLVLGALLQENYSPVHLNNLTPDEAVTAAGGAYAAAGVYAGLVVLCGVRFSYILIQSRRASYVRV